MLNRLNNLVKHWLGSEAMTGEGAPLAQEADGRRLKRTGRPRPCDVCVGGGHGVDGPAAR
jgi:hypothetical protein